MSNLNKEGLSFLIKQLKVDGVSDIPQASSTQSGLMSADDKKKLDGLGGTGDYVLPTATSSVLGGVKVGSDTVQSVAAASPSSTAGKTYPIQKNGDGQLVVNIPWTDTNTKVTSAANHYAPATETYTPTSGGAVSWGGSVVTGITKDSKGHITGVTTGAIPDKPGAVTSVGVSVPTGLSVSGSPVTSSGTISISLASGYSIPTTAKQTNWDTAYEWGDHSSAGYLKSVSVTNSKPTLSWGTTSTVGSVSGTNLQVTMPANPNTDTKVTAVGNHYTPSGGTTTSASGGASTNITGTSAAKNVVTGVTMDAAGHVTGVTSAALYSTDTHYTTHLYAGTGTASNLPTTNGNTKITVVDNTSVRDSVTIQGSGGVNVTSDGSGVINIDVPESNLLTSTDKTNLNSALKMLNLDDSGNIGFTQVNGNSPSGRNKLVFDSDSFLVSAVENSYQHSIINIETRKQEPVLFSGHIEGGKTYFCPYGQGLSYSDEVYRIDVTPTKNHIMIFSQKPLKFTDTSFNYIIRDQFVGSDSPRGAEYLMYDIWYLNVPGTSLDLFRRDYLMVYLEIVTPQTTADVFWSNYSLPLDINEIKEDKPFRFYTTINDKTKLVDHLYVNIADYTLKWRYEENPYDYCYFGLSEDEMIFDGALEKDLYGNYYFEGKYVGTLNANLKSITRLNSI